MGDKPTSVDECALDLEEPRSEGDPLDEFFVSKEECDLITQSFADGGEGEGGAAAARGTVGTLELLAFAVADEEYAVPIVGVQEIIKVPLITEVPRTGRAVLGIISLRGTIVPVLDLRRVLELEETPPSRPSRILVVRTEEDPVGLLVDRVNSVVRLDGSQLEATPRAIRRQTSDFVRGVGRLGSRLVIVLDVNAVLVTMDVAA